MLRNALIILGVGVFLLLFIPSLYLTAATIGALVPSSNKTLSKDIERPYEIKLFMSFLHADIAIPIDDDVAEKFAFLDQSEIPMVHPALRYLIFGWGSEAFYTTAGDYSDITLSASFKAITGDQSVMHIMPSGEIEFAPHAISLQLSKEGFQNLLGHIEQSFKKDASGTPILMEGATHGYGDVFYQAIGGFNIFHPCNIWVNEALKSAGVPLGVWTPTTQSLKLSMLFWNRK